VVKNSEILFVSCRYAEMADVFLSHAEGIENLEFLERMRGMSADLAGTAGMPCRYF